MGDTLTDWITALATAGALIAAVIAGLYARKAAIHAGEQADATDKQVQLVVQGQLDSGAPLILATARQAHSSCWLEYAQPTTEQMYDPAEAWPHQQVSEPLTVSNNSVGYVFLQIAVKLTNVSRQVALIEFPPGEDGEVVTTEDHRPLDRLVIQPNQSENVFWKRKTPIQRLANEAELTNPRNTRLTLTFAARDIGLNIKDTYQFDANLEFFSLSSDGIVIAAEPRETWTETVAELLPNREYIRRELV